MKEKSLGRQLVRFSLPAMAVLILLSSACSGSAPEKYSESPDAPNTKPTPDLVIPSATATETPLPTSTPQPTEIPKPVLTPAFSVKDEVVVMGTGSCLNIREQPSMNGKVIDCQKDGNIISVTGGPVSADGELWWQLNNENRWAVQSYLGRYNRQLYNPTALATANLASSSLEQQAQVTVLNRWLGRFSTSQGEIRNRETLLSLDSLNPNIASTTFNDGNIQALKIPLNAIMTVNWNSSDYGNYTNIGSIYRMVVGEVGIKNITTKITSKGNLSGADKANGINWRGEVRVDFIYQYRAVVRMSNNTSFPSIPFGDFSPWLNDYRIGTVQFRDGEWQFTQSTSGVIIPVDAMNIGIIGGMYQKDCPTIETGCLIPPPNAPTPVPERPRSGIVIRP